MLFFHNSRVVGIPDKWIPVDQAGFSIYGYAVTRQLRFFLVLCNAEFHLGESHAGCFDRIRRQILFTNHANKTRVIDHQSQRIWWNLRNMRLCRIQATFLPVVG